MFPFLDIKIEKSINKFLTSIYSKLTFVFQYTRKDSFGPIERKTKLTQSTGNLFRKQPTRRTEFHQGYSILRNKVYPEDTIDSSIPKKIAQCQEQTKEDHKNALSVCVFSGSAKFL